MLAALWGKPEVHCHAVVKHCACMLNNMNYMKFGAQFKLYDEWQPPVYLP